MTILLNSEKKIYVIEYRIDGRMQSDGEWFDTRAGAVNQAESNKRDNDWDYRITRLTLPPRSPIMLKSRDTE